MPVGGWGLQRGPQLLRTPETGLIGWVGRPPLQEISCAIVRHNLQIPYTTAGTIALQPGKRRIAHMLVLTRRPGEALIIDNLGGDESTQSAMADGITVTVRGVKGNRVRVGINAPADITILREELVPDTDAA